MNQFISEVGSKIKELRGLITRDSNVLLITHSNCLDGMGCQMVAQLFFKNLRVQKLAPHKVNMYVNSTDFSRYDVIIMADLSVDVLEFNWAPNVVVFDHHDSALYLRNVENNVFINNGNCGSKLLLTALKMIFKVDPNVNDFINCINDHDLWILGDNRSKCLNALYYQYKDEAFNKRFKKMEVNINVDEWEWYNKKQQETTEKAKELEVSDFGEVGLYVDEDYNNDLIQNVLENREHTIMVAYKPSFGGVSVRSRNDKVHLGNILAELNFGGGHKYAAGFRENDWETFKKKFEKFVEKINEILEC